MGAFDKIAKTATTSSKTTVKIAATVDDKIKLLVDDFINRKAQIKKLESDQDDVSAQVIAVVKPQQDELGYKGEYSSSLQVPGMKTKGALMVSVDKVSVGQDEETQNAIRKCLAKRYDDFFAKEQTITVKTKDEAIQARIVKACQKEGLDICEIFEVTDKIVAKKGFDERQYTLPKEKLVELLTLVKPTSSYLK